MHDKYGSFLSTRSKTLYGYILVTSIKYTCGVFVGVLESLVVPSLKRLLFEQYGPRQIFGNSEKLSAQVFAPATNLRFCLLIATTYTIRKTCINI